MLCTILLVYQFKFPLCKYIANKHLWVALGGYNGEYYQQNHYYLRPYFNVIYRR